MTEEHQRRIRVSIEGERTAGAEWTLDALGNTGRWAVFRDGELTGDALWSDCQLRWEPVPNSFGAPPSDTVLRVFHMLIGEAHEVPRTVAP